MKICSVIIIGERVMPKAPFTPEQVESLNGFQRCGCFHPFTCGKCRNDLIATEQGWVCQNGCDYTQDWAHDFMADNSWKKNPAELIAQVKGNKNGS